MNNNQIISKLFFKLGDKFDDPNIDVKIKKINLFVMKVICNFCKKNKMMGYLKRVFVSEDYEFCYFVFVLSVSNFDEFVQFFNREFESIPEPEHIKFIKIYDQKSSFNISYCK